MISVASVHSPNSRSTTFLSIPAAAELAGFSTRHFRRIIAGAGIPTVRFGRKDFILDRDFQSWTMTRSPK